MCVRRPEVEVRRVPLPLSILSFESGSFLLNSEPAVCLHRLAGEPWGSICFCHLHNPSTPSALALQMRTATHNFLRVWWGPNPGPHACVAGTFLLELSVLVSVNHLLLTAQNRLMWAPWLRNGLDQGGLCRVRRQLSWFLADEAGPRSLCLMLFLADGPVPYQKASKARARERVSREAVFLHRPYLQVPMLRSSLSFLSWWSVTRKDKMKQVLSSFALLLVSVLVQQQRPLQPYLSSLESRTMLGPNSVTPTTFRSIWGTCSWALLLIPQCAYFIPPSSLSPLSPFPQPGQTLWFVFSVCTPSFSPWPTLTSLITLSVG